MRIGYLYKRSIQTIAEPRRVTQATVDYGRAEQVSAATGDGDLQAVATHGAWNDQDYYPARSHVNTMGTRGFWPEALPAFPLQPVATHGFFDTTDNDPDLDYPATRGLMS